LATTLVSRSQATNTACWFVFQPRERGGDIARRRSKVGARGETWPYMLAPRMYLLVMSYRISGRTRPL
jgi:hypothetical protein